METFKLSRPLWSHLCACFSSAYAHPLLYRCIILSRKSRVPIKNNCINEDTLTFL
uniref:Uncharacterized protein n=1 Tax=Arundo donax TaxID=35708 RepID=A0A0A9F0V1_ARUDO